MDKEKTGDIWAICPECKNRMKKERLPAHMKRVHSKKMDDAKIKPLDTSHKTKGNKTSRFISKRIIGVLTIIVVVVVAATSLYILFNNAHTNQKPHIVSIDGKGNYASIQEAINAASANDILFVSNGTYFENIKITKSIELRGENKNTTIITGNGSGDVIYVLADHVKINSLTIKNGGSKLLDEVGAGIDIRSNYSTISNCNISSNKNYGLYLGGTIGVNIIDATIQFNTFFNNVYGIYTTNNVKTNNISSNTFTYNTEYGIFLTSQSNDNLVSDNIFTENNYAIRIKSSEQNTVIKNLITNNQKGLYFCCGAINNIAYNNIFINNTNWNAQDDVGNAWDKGTVGNYWSNYTGTDANGDGIGDTPYLINGGKEDRFPLMQPKFLSP
jgi:nitrous oxidase accessory protein